MTPADQNIVVGVTVSAALIVVVAVAGFIGLTMIARSLARALGRDVSASRPVTALDLLRRRPRIRRRRGKRR